MSIDSAKNNQIVWNFPKTFVPDEITNRYEKYLNRVPGNMITKPIDFINVGIQSVNFPGPSYEPVEQNDHPGSTIRKRSSERWSSAFDRRLDITFKAFDGYLNYWMMLEIMEYYYCLDGSHPWIPEGIGLQFHDGEGNIIVTAQMKEMIFTGMSDLNLDFSDNTAEFKTFTCNFIYNSLKIKINVD